MLRLYDHLAEVDFAAEGLLIARGGWPIQVAPMLPDRELADVTQTITFEWSETSAFKRNRVLQTLSELGQRAVLNQDPSTAHYHLPERWVVLESQTPGEGGYRYGIVTDVTIDNLDSLHHRADMTASLTVHITHKGAWWGISPHEFPPVLFDSDSLGNVDDATYDNFIEIDGSLIAGDVPALLVMDAVYVGGDAVGNGGDERITILSDGNINHLGADSASGGVVSTLVTGDLAGTYRSYNGKYWQTTGGNDATHSWNISDPSSYAGAYQLYVVLAFNNNTIGSVLTVSHGWTFNNNLIALDSINVDSKTQPSRWHSFYVGQITFPVGGSIPAPFTTDTTYPYRISLTIENAADTVYLAGIYLVPVSYPVLRIPLVTTVDAGWLADGRTQRVYQLNDSLEITVSNLEADGTFPTLYPNRNQRLYLYGLADSFDSFDYDLTRDVTVRVIPRYRYLRSG